MSDVHRLSGTWLGARLPQPTIRLRLTALYGVLFLTSGTALLAITYVLAAHQYTPDFFITPVRQGIVGEISPVPRSQPRSITGTPAPRLIRPVNSSFPTKVIRSAQAQANAARSRLVIDAGIALALMALLSVWLGWLVAGRALRPLRTITRAAQDISASNLQKRLALTGPNDEITQLGDTFDRLLARLETAFEAQRRFVANASHELRTPLAYERSLVEVTLADPDANTRTFREMSHEILVATEQHERLIDGLLTLARSDRGLERHERVDLASVAAARVRTTSHDGLTVETRLDPATTTGDPRLIERLIANLLHNAITHNTANGGVSVRTTTHDGRAILTIANSGPIVPAGELRRLFEPFARLGEGVGDADGSGLGLSIVQAIANAHNATLTATPQAEGGLHIEVGFPNGDAIHTV